MVGWLATPSCLTQRSVHSAAWQGVSGFQRCPWHKPRASSPRSPPSPPARCRSSAAPTLRLFPRVGAAEVLEGHGQLAQEAVSRLLQIAAGLPLFERSSLRRRVGRRALLQLVVKRAISGKSSGSCLWAQALSSSIMLARLVETFMLSTNLSGPQLIASASRPTCRGQRASRTSGKLPGTSVRIQRLQGSSRCAHTTLEAKR